MFCRYDFMVPIVEIMRKGNLGGLASCRQSKWGCEDVNANPRLGNMPIRGDICGLLATLRKLEGTILQADSCEDKYEFVQMELGGSVSHELLVSARKPMASYFGVCGCYGPNHSTGLSTVELSCENDHK